jgi:hypothetical protein
MAYQPIPIPSDYGRSHISFGQFIWLLDCSPRSGQRVLKTAKVKSFKILGKLRVDLDSANQYLADRKAEGPQTSKPPKTGKRPVGRPRKAAAEAAT